MATRVRSAAYCERKRITNAAWREANRDLVREYSRQYRKRKRIAKRQLAARNKKRCVPLDLSPTKITNLSPTQRAIIDALRSGEVVPSDTLVDRLYGTRRDGGPDNAHGAVRMMICKARRRLSEHGIEIETVGYGRGSDGYRLKNAEQVDT